MGVAVAGVCNGTESNLFGCENCYQVHVHARVMCSSACMHKEKGTYTPPRHKQSCDGLIASVR